MALLWNPDWVSKMPAHGNQGSQDSGGSCHPFLGLLPLNLARGIINIWCVHAVHAWSVGWSPIQKKDHTENTVYILDPFPILSLGPRQNF